MKLNFNDHVCVKLTEEGLKIMRETHNEMLKRMTPEQAKLVGPFKEPAKDEQGYSTFQMWELMYYFGPHMYNFNPPFEANMLIEDSADEKISGEENQIDYTEPKEKNFSYTKEEFHRYYELMNQGEDLDYLHKVINKISDNKNQNDGTITSTFASFMRSDDDTVIKAEAMREIIDKVLKEVRQEDAYVLSNVNNETKTFIVEKIKLPKGSYKLGTYKVQYDYLKKISALIGYDIMIKDLVKEESANLNGNPNETKISTDIITRINPQCSLSQSFLANPSKVDEFNKNLDKTLEENALKLYRGKKNADKMKPII